MKKSLCVVMRLARLHQMAALRPLREAGDVVRFQQMCGETVSAAFSVPHPCGSFSRVNMVQF